jgi:hypothetical protein
MGRIQKRCAPTLFKPCAVTVIISNMYWQGLKELPPKEFVCGFCGRAIASVKGYNANDKHSNTLPYEAVYICPNCTKPTYFSDNIQLPGIAPGVEVAHLPADVEALYREARNCIAIGAYTSSTLICRKMLMNISVQEGADAGKQFAFYVDFLDTQGYIPRNGKVWVDHIRKKGNEATHQVVFMTKADAEDLISFAEMLLRCIYEFPNRVPSSPPTTP